MGNVYLKLADSIGAYLQVRHAHHDRLWYI
jgi:hypothetical protein